MEGAHVPIGQALNLVSGPNTTRCKFRHWGPVARSLQLIDMLCL
jgi:hypothetical protein